MKGKYYDLNERHIVIIQKVQKNYELVTEVAALRHILDEYEKNQEEMEMNTNYQFDEIGKELSVEKEGQGLTVFFDGSTLSTLGKSYNDLTTEEAVKLAHEILEIYQEAPHHGGGFDGRTTIFDTDWIKERMPS